MLNRLSKMKREDGFTLIELLIVIIILGILIAIVIFGVGRFRADAVERCKEANAQTYKVAKAAYLAKYGTAASSDQQLIDEDLVDGTQADADAECG